MLFVPRFFRNLLLSGFMFAVSGAMASAEETPLFVEKFTGKLSAGWTWIDEVPGSWQLADEALELKVLPVGEGLWAEGRKHPNLLVREPGTKGDFAIEVQIKSQPTSQFEHAGLLLFADGDNYVVLNKEMFDKPEVVMVAEKDAKPTHRGKPYEHEEICLRLAVAGKKVTGQYRHYDSDAWQTLGELELPVPGPYKVGVFAGRPPKDADHRVRFSQFRIVPGSAAAAAQNAAGQPPANDAKTTSTPPAPPVQQSARFGVIFPWPSRPGSRPSERFLTLRRMARAGSRIASVSPAITWATWSGRFTTPASAASTLIKPNLPNGPTGR